VLLIANGCSGFCFLDGSTYAPLFHRTVSNECEWHPVKPALMICVSGNEAWNPPLDIRTAVYVFSEYKHLQFGPYNATHPKMEMAPEKLPINLTGKLHQRMEDR